MTTADWLPDELHPVAMRISRADSAAEELAKVALEWSRGPDAQGAVTLRQIERTPGVYDVEVASIRSVPPLAAILFSEAVHHLRSAVDNVAFHVAVKEHGQALRPEQERRISMLIYDTVEGYDEAVARMTRGRSALPAFGPNATLGKRIASLQPFNDSASLPSISPVLAAMMRVEAMHAHPLALLRDYSNGDKHQTIRLGLGRTLVQRSDQWQRSVGLGMRDVQVGTLLEQVSKGVPTGVEISPALQVQRPDGTWVGYGPELDGLARHVTDIVIPTLLTGMALPGAIPVNIDLGDNGETLVQRLENGGTSRAHERVQGLMAQALAEADAQGWKVAPAKDHEPHGTCEPE